MTLTQALADLARTLNDYDDHEPAPLFAHARVVDAARKVVAAAQDAPRARRSDPDTSWQAARKALSGPVAAAVLRVLQMYDYPVGGVYGLTDPTLHSVVQQYGVQSSPSGVRSRRAELVRLGLVEDSGHRRRNSHTGRQMTVWALTDRGRTAADELR